MSRLVFLDFDGVICDSAPECFASSWEAYFGRSHREVAPAALAGLRARFLGLRPYVRTGEDFMICQEILHRELPVGSQADFDAVAAAKGSAELTRLRDRFDQARAALLARDRAYWIGLNSLYPEVAAHLPRWAGSPRLYVLSTKRSEFIAEILAAAGIRFPFHRILYAAKTEKGPRIEEILERRGSGAALLVDDQIDHLLAIRAGSSRVSVYLAAWGYVRPEWLVDSPVAVLTLDELRPLVDDALVDGPGG